MIKSPLNKHNHFCNELMYLPLKVDVLHEDDLAKRFHMCITPLLKGSALPCGTIEISINNYLVGRVIASSDGRWSMPDGLAVMKFFAYRNKYQSDNLYVYVKRYTEKNVLVCKSTYKINTDIMRVSVNSEKKYSSTSLNEDDDIFNGNEKNILRGMKWFKSLLNIYCK